MLLHTYVVQITTSTVQVSLEAGFRLILTRRATDMGSLSEWLTDRGGLVVLLRKKLTRPLFTWASLSPFTLTLTLTQSSRRNHVRKTCTGLYMSNVHTRSRCEKYDHAISTTKAMDRRPIRLELPTETVTNGPFRPCCATFPLAKRRKW